MPHFGTVNQTNHSQAAEKLALCLTPCFFRRNTPPQKTQSKEIRCKSADDNSINSIHCGSALQPYL